MLLMQNNVVSSYVRSREESHRRAHHHQQQHQEFKPPPWTSAAAAAAAAASLEKFWPHEALEHPVRQLNWASVASWFMRPEARAAAPAQDTLPAPTVCTSIRCTVPGCSCECFTPGKLHIRYCESCSHGWVPHALDKLGFRHMLGQNAVEPVQLNVAFDIASLVLYGCQALPIRLKILLDRLFSVLQRDEVVQVLRGFGWTQEDYARGYILQEPHGAVLDRWNICSPEEEPLVLQQFLRFGETRAITQQLLMHGLGGGLPRAAEADIKRLLDARDEHRRGSLPPGSGSGTGSKPPTLPPVSQPQAQQSVHPPPSAPIVSRTQQPPPPLPPPHQAPLSPQQKLGFRLPPTGLTCTPASTPSSPPTSSASSPLNKLQNMRPFDFRKITLPERRRVSEDNTSVPQNLSLSNSASVPVCLPPPSAPSSLLGHKSPSSEFYHGSTTAASSEFGSDDDEDDEENSLSALNLSRDSPGSIKQQRLGHHRKSVTPVKRHWGSSGLPANLGTQLINPATGKKRVQCNVCLKTFCDKGALKIHYSAVHLREMHKCTVEGCNMMFSSRRSRNRHSANPNPKLHSPHLRRKISPHDGRSSQNHPLLMAPLAGLSPLSFGPFPLLTPPPPELRHQAAALDLKQSLDLSAPRRDGRKLSGNESSDQAYDFVMYDDDEDGIVIEGGEDMVSQNGEKSRYDGGPASKMPRYKMSESEDDDGVSNVEDSNEDSLSVVDSQSLKEESGPENLVTKSSRKRKNQNPTRCPVSASAASHEGLSDDDSCTDVYQRRTPEKRAPEVVKGSDLTVKAVEEVENNNTITMKKEPVEKYAKDDVEGDKEPSDLRVRVNNEEATNLSIKRESSPHDNVKDAKNEEIKSEESAVESSNALRQLESLSQGHFGSESYRHSGQGDPPSPARSNASSGSSNGGDSDTEVYGHFQDGAFVAAMEVPIDKDNPRMCTACGKVFQNHFSVKTHYQNVHLKLMHKCTVDGCNAAFPSKRSRDRHSANFNLHRKLLSTSLTDKAAASLFLESHLTPHSLHPEFLARLYADSHLPPSNLLNGDRLVPGHPLFPYPLGLTSFRGFPHLGPPLENGGGRSSSVGSHSPHSNPTSPHLVLADDDDDARSDSDGRFVCRFCSANSFESSQRLREHIESSHLSDCHRCTHADCPLVFISVKRRNVHSEDETAHPRLPS